MLHVRPPVFSFFRIQLIVSLFMINSRQLNSSRTSMAYPSLFSGNSYHRNAGFPSYPRYYKDQSFPFPEVPPSLLRWSFPSLPERSWNHNCLQSCQHLPKKIHQNGISYTLVGDYYIPDLKLPEESRPIGRWGRMHKAFLQEHRPGQYNALLLSGM